MASAAQIDANRVNATHSTGPRTDEGKAQSSRNAVRHGLTSKHFIVREDEQEEFAALKESLIEELAPSTAVTWQLFTHLLHAAWNMQRVRRIEAELFSNNIDPLANESCRHQIELLMRYHARSERSYYRALREYRDYLTNLALRDTLPHQLLTESALPVSTERIHRTYRSSAETWKGYPSTIWDDPDNPEPKPDPPVWKEPPTPAQYL